MRGLVRRIAWVAQELFWNQLFPVASGFTSNILVEHIASNVLPETSSPFITGHLLRVETVDGALMAGVMPTHTWQKLAIPKGLPANGGKSLAIENLPHEVNDFSGEIAKGYGKGIKTLLLSDSVIVKVEGKTSVQKINYHIHDADVAGKHFDLVVTGVKPGVDKWELNIPRGEYKGRYAFVTTPKGMIVTRMVDNGLRMPKPDYTLRKEELLTSLDPTKVIVERKIDGSLGNAVVKDQRVMFRSHRETGQTYYDSLPGVEFLKNESSFVVSRLLYPGPSLNGTVFQGELWHPEGSARTSGILNSLPPMARATQQKIGVIKFAVWDILKYKGRDVSELPYSERRALYEKLVKEIRVVNKNWQVVEQMPKGMSPLEYYKLVTMEELPLGEGVVIKLRDATAQKWDKVKLTSTTYWKLVEVVEGEGKYKNSVGRIVVESLDKPGVRGELGSLAVPDSYRDWLWKYRDELTGEIVKARVQSVTDAGRPRAGTFLGFHNGESNLLMAADSQAAGDKSEAMRIKYSVISSSGWRSGK